MVFFFFCKFVKYYYELLNYIDLFVLVIYVSDYDEFIENRLCLLSYIGGGV